MSTRVTTPGRRIKSIAGIEQIAEMMTANKREAWEESFPLNTPRVLFNQTLKSDSGDWTGLESVPEVSKEEHKIG